METNNPFIVLKEFASVNNPSSIHGVYPYRGKISALDAKSIIAQLPTNGTLLDPFCGSGTIVYEAQKHGLTAFGVDNNPLAVQIAKAKVYKGSYAVIEQCEYIIKSAKADLISKNYEPMPECPLRSFHPETANEIMTVKNHFAEMNDYLKGIFYGSIALAARGCNGYKWTSSTVGKNIEPKTYINFYEKFIYKAKNTLNILFNNLLKMQPLSMGTVAIYLGIFVHAVLIMFLPVHRILMDLITLLIMGN